MTARAASPRRSGSLLLAAVFTLLGVAFLASLGFWQIDRAGWKANLIGTLNARLTATPSALPAAQAWPALDAEGAEFRRVAFTATFDHAQEALIFTGPSALRPDTAGSGYWVMTPARLADGGTVMVNRGFVPETRREPGTRADGQVEGALALTGVMRWPEARGLFTPADNPQRNLWFLRDHLAVAEAKGVSPVAPFYIDLEAPLPPGGLPQAGPLQVRLSDNHMGYAVTWFGLALALFTVFLIWAVRRVR